MSFSKTPNKQKPMNLKLQKRLATYSTAANLTVLSGLALSGIAHATPVRIEIDPDVVHNTPGLASGYGIDFDQDMNNEFRVVFNNVFGNSMYLDRSTNGGDQGMSAVASIFGPYSNRYAKALNMSTDIGPSRTDILGGAAVFWLGYNTVGNFPGAGDKYVGVKFQLDGVNTHYGWILLNVASDSSSVTVKAYGYDNTPDTGIPTAVNLLEMKADAVAPWWRQVAVGAFSMLTALSLWWRRRLSK